MALLWGALSALRQPCSLGGGSEKWKGAGLFREAACSLSVWQGRATTGPAHPPQSPSVWKGLSGTGNNKQSQAAKMQGLIMQFMDFSRPLCTLPPAAWALQKKVLAKGRLAVGLKRWPLSSLSWSLAKCMGTACSSSEPQRAHMPTPCS